MPWFWLENEDDLYTYKPYGNNRSHGRYVHASCVELLHSLWSKAFETWTQVGRLEDDIWGIQNLDHYPRSRISSQGYILERGVVFERM